MVSAKVALERLRDGNRRFINGDVSKETLANRKHQAGTAQPQTPFAIVLACSDSRVPTELIFDRGIGELFVIRVAGNIVSPTQVGSIEYAAKTFGTRLVVVLGHSNCGAVTATLDQLALKTSLGSPNLEAIVDRIRPAAEPLLETYPDKNEDELIALAIRANILMSVERLIHDSSIIEELVNKRELNVVGAEYSIETGIVEFLDAT